LIEGLLLIILKLESSHKYCGGYGGFPLYTLSIFCGHVVVRACSMSFKHHKVVAGGCPPLRKCAYYSATSQSPLPPFWCSRDAEQDLRMMGLIVAAAIFTAMA